MTEEEAKTKWCPKVQLIAAGEYVIDNRGSHNMSGDNAISNDSNCIASECMWWVWDEEFTSENLAKEGETPIWATGSQTSKKYGHCGAIK